MKQIKTDLLVIGAGSGGLSVAAGAVQMGADVTLLEGHKMGGDCLNYGCVPSKALLAAGHAAHTMTTGAAMGITPVTPEIDFSAAKDHVMGVIDHIAPVDSQERFEGLGVRVIRAFGHFTGPKTVTAGDTEITARRIVIATGSSPFVPAIPGLDQVPYYTNETVFELRERPDHLIIVGGGPIGMEMAQAHRRLGCKVTVLEGQSALGKEDPELAAIVLENLRGEGVEIVEHALVSAVSRHSGEIVVTTSKGDVSGSHLLMAVGRHPNIDKLDLEKAGVKAGRAGIEVDDQMRSSNRKVFAIGDVAGGLQFTHVAGYHAGLIIKQALFGLPAKNSTKHIPWATYTDPEIAQVGLTEAQAQAQYGDKLEVVRTEFAHNDRAIASRQNKGLVKVMIVKGRPVGASIVGPQAGELIATWSLVIANKIKMAGVSAMIAPYPTLAEVNKRAAGAYFSPRLFDSLRVKQVVRLVQKLLP